MVETISKDDILELDFQFGPTLVAATSGNRDRFIASKWISGITTPTEQEARRLTFALEQFRRVAQSEGSDIARAWFIGENILSGLSPFMAIRDDNFDPVTSSANRLIEGTSAY